jgi:hypothetical protein
MGSSPSRPRSEEMARWLVQRRKELKKRRDNECSLANFRSSDEVEYHSGQDGGVEVIE